MTSDEAGAGSGQFSALPARVRPEDWVETVDTAAHPVVTEEDERARLLRLAGGGGTP
jgi:hypothetical protein